MGKWVLSNAVWDALVEVVRNLWEGTMTGDMVINLLSWVVFGVFSLYGMYVSLRRVGGWVSYGLLRNRRIREQAECTDLLGELVQMLAPRDEGWPVVDYLRQKDLVETLKRRELLPSHIKVTDGGLRDICLRMSEIVRKYNVKHARRFVKEYLSQ